MQVGWIAFYGLNKVLFLFYSSILFYTAAIPPSKTFFLMFASHTSKELIPVDFATLRW